MALAYVLVKQVPDSRNIDYDPVTGSLIRSSAGSVPNPADADALAAYLKLKTLEPAFTGRALTMGPKQARASLREALASGLDEAYHLRDSAFAGADVYATAYALSQAIRSLEIPDLILCGEKSEDSETGQVPGELAALLEFTYLPNVTAIESIAKDLKTIRLRQELDGVSYLIEADLPAVLVAKSGAFPQHFATLREKMAAKRKPLHAITLADLPDANPEHYGYPASPTQVKAIYTPQINRKTERLDGWSDALWDNLVREAEAEGEDRFKREADGDVPEATADLTVLHTGDPAWTLELLGAADHLVTKAHLRVLGSREADLERLDGFADAIVCFEGAAEAGDAAYLDGLIRYLADLPQPTDGLLISADDCGLALAPQLAAKLRLGLTASCTDFAWEDDGLTQIRPAYGDRLLAAIRSQNKPAVATVRRTQFPEKTEADRVTEWLRIALPEVPARIRILEREEPESRGALTQEDIVLLLGNGITDEQDFNDLIALAEQKGWGWRVTRPLVKGGWADPERQVGVSGKNLKAKLCLLLGVGGSRQTMEGLKQVGTLVAVNADPEAAVFDYADYGYVGNWRDVALKLKTE